MDSRAVGRALPVTNLDVARDRSQGPARKGRCMSTSKIVEKNIQRAIRKLQARIRAIKQQHNIGANNMRLRLMNPEADAEMRFLEEQINNLPGRIAAEMLDELEPLARLGFSRRKSMSRFAQTHAKDLHASRSKEWQKWQAEADQLKKINSHLANNKSQLARRVKAKLKLTESIRTIRARIV